MSKRVCDVSRVLEVAESTLGSEIFLTVKMLMFDTRPNANHMQYTREFITEIAENQDKYLSLPLVADVRRLIDGDYGHLTHLLDRRTGEFLTAQIGSFVAFEAREDEEGELCLIGTARIPKRHGKVCEAVKELYDNNALRFSYEIWVAVFEDREDVALVDRDDENYLIGLCIVSDPAHKNATALLVASIEDMAETAAKALVYLTPDLEAGRLMNMLNVALFKYFQQHGMDDCWDYYTTDLYVDHAILCRNTDGSYYKVVYEIVGDQLVITDWQAVQKSFVPKNEPVNNQEKGGYSMEQNELQAQLDTMTLLAESRANEIAELTNKVNELTAQIAESDAKVVTIGEELQAANATIAELTPYKEKVEQMEIEAAEREKEAKREELRTRSAAVLDETEMTEIAQAIEDLDEAAVNRVLAEKYIKMVTENKPNEVPATASRGLSDTIGLSGGSLVEQYITLN